tara:strand:+ start:950 stop:2638 length:1689 start_codon:yes stop_codon:yes gene_type:complete
MYKKSLIYIFFFTLLISNILLSGENYDQKIQPELNSTETINETKISSGKSLIIVSANGYATKGAQEILSMGGNAADAAVTLQLILGLVEPQSSGLGGGSFALFYNNKNKKISFFDGRERAPKKIRKDHFLDKHNKPQKFFDAAIGGKSVGVPGTLKTLHKIHSKFGKLDWNQLFKPAIKLASEGFIPPPRLVQSLKREKHLWKIDQDNSFFEKIIKNPDQKIRNIKYEKTLRKLSNNYKVFYEGKIAETIVRSVKNANINPGLLEKSDLLKYDSKESRPLCTELKDRILCGPRLPSSGGILLSQALIIYENYNFNPDVSHKRKVLDILSFIYNERASLLGDPEFDHVNTSDLTKKSYILNKFDLHQKNLLTKNKFNEKFHSTSHFSIHDNDGNVISMTSSIENGFGSRLFVDGFLLNNQLTDFSFNIKRKNKILKNIPEGGKRPLSSMSPTLIFDKNYNFLLSIGSPGGTAIISYVLKNIINILYLDIDPLYSVNSGNYLKKGTKIYVEKDKIDINEFEMLKRSNEKIITMPLTSGLGIIFKKNDVLFGIEDSRRDGSVFAK